ncbi:MAG: hypothetical protein SV422_13870 [Pseudomonadota bacterium]|nr:hypothetical protein [Pseudomonadota bacterium]
MNLPLPRLLLNVLLFVAVAAPAVFGVGSGGGRREPEFYVWAWQRNEDLSFIDPATTKVALWLGTIDVADARLTLTPRRNSVVYPAGTEVLGVIRIEIDEAYSETLAVEVARSIRGLATPLRLDEIQLDFDARVSQRALYRSLVLAVREALPGVRLSITALASWCLGDPWLDMLPIDAAVPMLYRMGSDGPRIRQYLSRQRQFPAMICRDDIGYSSDEPVVRVRGVKRIFWYHPTEWDAAALTQAHDAMRAPN